MRPGPSSTRLAVIAILGSLPIGCGPRPEPTADPVAVPVADPVPGFVGFLRHNGVVLEEDDLTSDWWKVVEPPPDGPYRVVVALKGFPPDRTVAEMERDLRSIGIPLQLNAPARLMMSHPGLQVRPDVPVEQIPDAETLPVTRTLDRLFRSYPGPQAAAKPGR